MGWNCLLEFPSVSETRVNRLSEGHFHRGVLPGGVLLRVMYSDGCLLGSLGFWSPINRGTSSLLGFYLNFSCYEGFFSRHYLFLFWNFQSSSSRRPTVHYLRRLLHSALLRLQWSSIFSVAPPFSLVLGPRGLSIFQQRFLWLLVSLHSPHWFFYLYCLIGCCWGLFFRVWTVCLVTMYRMWKICSFFPNKGTPVGDWFGEVLTGPRLS